MKGGGGWILLFSSYTYIYPLKERLEMRFLSPFIWWFWNNPNPRRQKFEKKFCNEWIPMEKWSRSPPRNWWSCFSADFSMILVSFMQWQKQQQQRIQQMVLLLYVEQASKDFLETQIKSILQWFFSVGTKCKQLWNEFWNDGKTWKWLEFAIFCVSLH